MIQSLQYRLIITFLRVIALTSCTTYRNFNALKKSANKGGAAAQYNPGVIYANGISVTQDHVEANKRPRLSVFDRVRVCIR